jgi:hypothetical protein
MKSRFLTFYSACRRHVSQQRAACCCREAAETTSPAIRGAWTCSSTASDYCGKTCIMYQCLQYAVSVFAAASCACLLANAGALACAFFVNKQLLRLYTYESAVAIMSPLNHFIKIEDDLSRESKRAMADQAMHSTAAENKKLLPSVRGKRPPG